MRTITQKAAASIIEKLFSKAGIAIDGQQPEDIQVLDKRFYPTVLKGGSLALGETYMKGWWECRELDRFFYKLIKGGMDNSPCKILPETYCKLRAMLTNRQAVKRAFDVGEHHYNAGNELFELMLDPHMTYSCGYWRDADSLTTAQENKLDLICRKLRLEPGMKLLDIGCGWGSLAKFAAENYGVSVVGLTVSDEQAKLARERCRNLPIEIRLQDYRETEGKFEAIASVGMFEHVGYKNYTIFMKVAARLLKENGLFLLHSIGANTTRHYCDPWFDKYIFPNGMLPSIKQIGKAVEKRFIMEDWQNLGIDYEKTVLCWYRNFEQNWDKIKANYSDHFHRMWRYYLLAVAAGFRARHMQVWQIVLSPADKEGGYQSIRCTNC